ncbi:MAG: TRAP transporter substrate-binding protein [Deltaproteobacteria bacterium]|nr:MAG: TRAP transporter substrate-binding protein [Deltaproteobacteria bacterium]
MKRTLSLALAAVTALTVATTSTVVEANSPIELAVGSLAPEGSPWRKLLREVKERFEEKSGNRLRVALRPAGFMGEVEMVQETRKGERLQACGVTTAAIAQGGNVPTMQLVELPFLFRNNAEADFVLDGLKGTMGSILERRGFKLAIWSENGWRSFGTKSKAIRTPEDLKGLKMRAQESDVHMAMYRMYGATAVEKPMTEVLTGLNSNVLDGLDNTALFMQAGGLGEPLKYFTLSRHIYQPAAILYSKAWFDKLPADLQEIVMDVDDLSAKGRRMIRAEEGAMMDNWEFFGVEVIELNAQQREAFAKPARGMHDSFAAGIDGGPELLKEIRAKIAERGK